MMATLDLRDPDVRESAGLLIETVSIPSQRGNSPAHGRSRAETMGLIMEALQDGPKTRTQIARQLGRRKTPWLIGLCEELVSVGLICRGYSVTHNGLTVIVYGVEAS